MSIIHFDLDFTSKMWKFSVVTALCMVAFGIDSSSAFAPPLLSRSPLSPPTTMNGPLEQPACLLHPSESTTALFGIPKMFRWLTDQYPDIINNRLDEGLAEDIAVDNFYLDMNGIIHPCTHGNNENELIYLDETAMFKKIFLYVDRLYKMVQPNKVLYLAVDGTAPRAKMNQQRSRRFRAAKEAEQLAADLAARENFKGKKLENDPTKKRFDSNCITPGTDFMLKLSLALQKWVDYKLKTDPFWMNGATVVVSGPDVPGEGEHKVMEFIRDNQAEYKKTGQSTDLYGPGLTHVLYGLDADLIMLGLVTHENNFMLLREKMSVVMAGRGRNKYRKKKDMMEYTRHDFELLELSSLRKLLAIQFRKFSDQLAGDYSLDRIVDDFVFMCMLVGNDFLSHTPHLEINTGAVSLMLTTYIDLLPDWGGYLTDREKISPERFEEFIYNLSVYEEEHFKKRGYEENEPGWKLEAESEHDENDFYGMFYSGNPTPACAVAANFKGSEPPPSRKSIEKKKDEDDEAYPELAGPKGNRAFRRQHPDSKARSYRDFYYESKLGWPMEDRERTLFNRRAHAREFLEGLHWNLNYYHNGCCDWDWYFPHFYSPLATDMVNLDEFYSDDQEGEEFKSFHFDLGTPFPSLAQLLSVLPPQSATLLPEALGELMIHPSSPIIENYPNDFTTDPNGKRQAWEAIVKIPFINGEELLSTVEQVLEKDGENGKDLLTPSERRRNRPGKIHYFKPEKESADVSS